MNRLRTSLGLERNIVVMLASIIVLGIGEELWTRFVPKYLELLGATTWVVAWYGTLRDFLDAVYQYPGGWLADTLGRRKALVAFTLIAIIGYLIFAVGRHWIWILVGTVFVMAWGSLTSPAVFAIIGDNLPRARRSIGFGVQSIIKRVPVVIAPTLGGLLVASLGFVDGIRVGVIITIVLALLGITIIGKYYREIHVATTDGSTLRSIWREMDPYLKRLLLADCLARWAEGIPKVFIILYALDVLHVSPLAFGTLTSLQMATSIIVYIPIAKLSDTLNRKPFVLLTFAFFALFPLVLAGAASFTWIVLAFMFAGLREIGEPARKALIVDLAQETARGRAVGIYYLVRGLVVFPASLAGGLLWTLGKQLPFYAAFAIGTIGFIVYALTGPGEKSVRT
ncbi:MAG: MFS transporter [Ignavibacteriae bacterium]|nr:MFS transporter [Ignavibacteria bacterium]MBI3363924.1 MFS transporter [Ignavibacteriota bacterium]